MPRDMIACRRPRPRSAEEGTCPRCHGGQESAPCICLVQDRCNETTAKGAQCVLGVGHTLKHVTSTGVYWR